MGQQQEAIAGGAMNARARPDYSAWSGTSSKAPQFCHKCTPSLDSTKLEKSSTKESCKESSGEIQAKKNDPE
jgi:hypothetical protein